MGDKAFKDDSGSIYFEAIFIQYLFLLLPFVVSLGTSPIKISAVYLSEILWRFLPIAEIVENFLQKTCYRAENWSITLYT